jgi:competence protein ComEC
MSNETLTIYTLNVGQADTSVIITPKNTLVIIDAVRPDKLVHLLKNIGFPKTSKIQELIITHPHLDHFSGANRLLTDYIVNSVTLAPFWNAYGAGPPTYRQMINKIEKENCPVDFISGYGRIYPEGALTASGSTNPLFDTESIFIELLGPPNSMISQLERDGKLDTNHLSIMARLNWKNFKMVFAGDAQMENWSHFDSEGMLSENCNILRSSHHGSCNGTQWERIDRMNPKYVIISSDPDKKHHLPDVVGTSIFAKYEVSDTSKVIALSKDTGSLKITVTDGMIDSVQYLGDLYDENIQSLQGTTLTAANNPTDWKSLLASSTQKIYE